MNILKGKITNILTHQSLSLVQINVGDILFKTIVIDTPDTVAYLKLGNNVNVIFKETEVVIGKGLTHKISLQNKVVGKIISIEKGKLLSKLAIDSTAGKIIAIITSNAIEQLKLQVNEQITAMIKTNEIMLSA